MTKISLNTLDIRNFKGIEQRKVSFTNRTEIYGKNGTGKTTILDAFLWCLFGKDSAGASDFSVKRKNPDGTDVRHTDVDVLCELSIDGKSKTFRRRFVEKWTTPRGASEPEFRGHTSEYFIDEVPISATDYPKLISEICEEGLFKLLTTAGAFNRMKDADRRKELSKMVENITDMDLAVDFPNVLEAFKAGKTLEQYRDQIKAQKKRVADEKEQYPARLKENADMRPEPVDFQEYEKKEKEVLAEIEKYQKQLSGSGSEVIEQEKSAFTDTIRDLDAQMKEIEDTVDKDLRKKKEDLQDLIDKHTRSLSSAEKDKSALEVRKQSLGKDIAAHNSTLDRIREEWTNENERKCDDMPEACPTCGRGFEGLDYVSRKNELVKKFNEEKLTRLSDITKRGNTESNYISGLQTSLSDIEQQIKTLDEDIANSMSHRKTSEISMAGIPARSVVLEANMEYVNIRTKRDETKAKMNSLTEPSGDSVQAQEKIDEANIRLKSIRAELAKKGEIERADQRKEELLKKQKELGQSIAEYDAIEYEILQFSMKKTDLIESSVASKFRLVRFKMFDHNITNDGVKEVCICTVNGVPYNDLNTAMQINADIDIINALSSHYGKYMPVFIDGAESINHIEETESQRIDLYVTLTDDTLRIEHK